MTLGHMSSFSFRICFRRLLNSFLPCLRLYDEAKRNGLQLSQYHYNVLLYVCSLSDAETESSSLNPGLNRGFDMFKQMTVDKVVPNEATFTNGARLERHGPFDAVIDGANMGFVNQRSFSFFQLNDIVQRFQEISPSKRLPFVILHKSRVVGGPATYPKNRALLEKWKNAGALYATPPGSNDD
ncbi:unnamed protein product [Brassica rapa]|uniref:PRORP domain-containing protein n=2 Tax=Brassica TaxID=3705 RepID=A0A8D9HY90_BRACM|nr:unnamed protein product [Brassica napus]CAG7907700.1 unnamed protein product [Brassica rapa]